MKEEKCALLIYDISLSKTYRQVMGILNSFNFSRIQKSVYLIMENEKRMSQLFSALEEVLDSETDKLALLRLCDDDWQGALSSGISVLSFSHNNAVMIL